MQKDLHKNRKLTIRAIFTVIILIYVIRLFTIQVVETRYKQGAENNALLNNTIYPPRGLIFDRNKKLLVYNKPAYDVIFINREIENLDTLGFCKDLGVSKTFFLERMAEVKDRRKNRGYSSYTPQVFMSQLSISDVANIQQNIYKYRGFSIRTRTLREYSFSVAGVVLGSIGEVSSRMIERDDYYKRGDYAGRDGLERTYEKALRGEKGMEVMLRDARGRIKGHYQEGKDDEQPKSGKDLNITLDVDLQMLGEELLNGKIGSIVAIEPATGEILALVSSPSYDPALLVGRERSKNYRRLLKDSTKPLYNRATQAQYSPGSTFKPLQAVVCMQLGGITKDTRFVCGGHNSRPIRCTHFHGSPVSIYNSIEQSCNPFYWQAFRNTIERRGYGVKNQDFKKSYNEWRDGIMKFGLGARFTDSDLSEQNQGNIPSIEYYDKLFGKTGYRAITIRSLAIGQGEVLVTPLQLANATAVMANKGYYITPHLNRSDSMLLHRHETGFGRNYFVTADSGMWRVNEYGTGRHFKIPNIASCGKTGTVENGGGSKADHSLYIGFAPRENPQIAVAVVVENAGFGSTWASPIASLIMEQYLFKKIERKALKDRISHTILNRNVKKY